jgi:transcriptional regulator with XRE-family HTH domain
MEGPQPPLTFMSKSSYHQMAMRSRTSASFEEFYAQLADEARAEGPAAVLDLRAKEVKYALINTLITRRQALNLTQEALAEQSGIAQAEISRIERGRKSPTLDTFSRLAGALRLALWPIDGEQLDARKAGTTQRRVVLAARRIDIPRPKPLATQVTTKRRVSAVATPPAALKATPRSRAGSKKNNSLKVARPRKSIT